MNSYQVQIFELSRRDGRTRPWRVRWAVAGRRFEESYRTKELANSFRSELVRSANAGEPFESRTGLPASQARAMAATTWYEHARAYVEMKWPRLAARSRRSIVEALTGLTVSMLIPAQRGRPDDALVREALYVYALNPRRWSSPPASEHAAVLAWIEGASLPVVELQSPAVVRRVLDGLCLRLDGRPAAATTVRRRRAVLYNALTYAVELGLLDSNPIDRVQWRAPEVADAVDRRVVANPVQVASLLEAVGSLGERAHQCVAFFGCLYYAGMRPSEAADVRLPDCHLPGTCVQCGTELADLTAVRASPRCRHQATTPAWGRVTLVGTSSHAGSHWTDDGTPHEHRGLKHRARAQTRSVPIPPRLVELICKHVQRHGTAPDGRLFRGLHGGPLPSSIYNRWWKLARQTALSPAQVASPLARRPYDLRHAAASLWLNAGIPATEVARRLGHGVAVLLRVYANCLDGADDQFNERLDGALR